MLHFSIFVSIQHGTLRLLVMSPSSLESKIVSSSPAVAACQWVGGFPGLWSWCAHWQLPRLDSTSWFLHVPFSQRPSSPPLQLLQLWSILLALLACIWCLGFLQLGSYDSVNEVHSDHIELGMVSNLPFFLNKRWKHVCCLPQFVWD